MSAIGTGRKSTLRVRQNLEKYRIERRIAMSAFATVYQAYDTIEGTRVALKIPHLHLTDDQFIEDFRKEVRLTAKLDHENILPVKNASFINGLFVIVLPLGDQTLADRLQRRMSIRTMLDFAEQGLNAVAYAHSKSIIHCDIKPENFILFSDNRLRLTDFGIAKMSLHTIEASGSGTIGYVAPEQAMGRPSFRSDVFSLGLIFYRMLTGYLPSWPYKWPLPGHEKLRKFKQPDLINLLRRAIEINPGKRFRDAGQMSVAFRRLKPRLLYSGKKSNHRKKNGHATRDWKEVRLQQFKRVYGRLLETKFTCRRCSRPVSESMRACPWCGTANPISRDETLFPAQCPRCKRGIKLDWKFCPWCYGRSFTLVSPRKYSDLRYQARCSNPKCSRKILMPFMHYCPWCHRAVQKKWKIPGSKDKCPSCEWGILKAFWDYCPWCRIEIKH